MSKWSSPDRVVAKKSVHIHTQWGRKKRKGKGRCTYSVELVIAHPRREESGERIDDGSPSQSEQPKASEGKRSKKKRKEFSDD